MDCIITKHKISEDGYPRVWYLDRGMNEHRKLFHELYGIFPEVVHHTCGNKSCVNPIHLVGMTYEEHRLLHPRNNGHSDKQFCNKGHEFTEENTRFRIRVGLVRVCRTCHRERERARKEKYGSSHH